MLRFFRGALQTPTAMSSAPDSEPQPAGDFYGWAPVLRLALGHAGHGSPWQVAGVVHNH